MREARSFTFNNVSSEDMGVTIASVETGLFEEPLVSDREIVETEIPGRDKPYLQRVDKMPLSFSLTIFLEEWRTRDNLRAVARWLFQPYYLPLVFDSNRSRIYYAILEGESNLMHNGARDGYVTLNVRCDSPFVYSPIQRHRTEVNGESEFTLYNSGDIPIRPKMWINNKSDGDLVIENTSTNQTVSIENLQADEEVFIDFENQEIVSSLEYLHVYHYDNHNGEWLELMDDNSGRNDLIIHGDCDIDIEYEMKYISGWGD